MGVRTTFSIQIYIAGAVVVGIFLYRFMYGTDTPHIKGLPEVPGLPVFGSLYELGTNHAKVRGSTINPGRLQTHIATENCLCQFFRVRPPPLDYESVRIDLAPYASHLPQGCLVLPRLHNRYLTLGRVMQEPPQSGSHCSQPPSSTILHAPH